MSDLLIEEIDLGSIENQILEEQDGMVKIKQYYIHGPFMVSETLNGNKRIYPRAVIEREVNTYNEKKIKENRGLGELQHPQGSEINLDRVSHLIKELKMDGNIAYGKAQILDTPCGSIARKLLEAGVKLGVSSRATGTLKNGIVQNDLRLITPADIVSDPSGPNCWVSALSENKEWVMANGVLTEQDISETKKEVDQIIIETKFSMEDRQAALTKLFSDCLAKISRKSLSK